MDGKAWRRRRRGCENGALIFETLFAALLTGINRKNGSPGVSLSFATKRQFRSNLPFSQQLRSEFRSCEIDVTVLRSGTRVPKPLSQLRNALRNGTFGAKSRFSISQWVSQLRNWCYCTAKWHSCAKSTFAAAKYTRRGFYSAAEWFGNKNHISQKFSLPCEISQSSVFPLFLLCFGSNFGPIFFLSIPLKFLPPGII